MKNIIFLIVLFLAPLSSFAQTELSPFEDILTTKKMAAHQVEDLKTKYVDLIAEDLKNVMNTPDLGDVDLNMFSKYGNIISDSLHTSAHNNLFKNYYASIKETASGSIGKSALIALFLMMKSSNSVDALNIQEIAVQLDQNLDIKMISITCGDN